MDGAGAGEAGVRLRPVHVDDLWIYQRIAIDEAACGEFNWNGFRDPTHVRRELERDGCLGAEGGRLIVLVDAAAVGDVVYSRADQGMSSWCWAIGVILLPEYRGRGIGTSAQRVLAEYLLATTPVERIEGRTDAANLAERRALEKAGFSQEGVIRRSWFRAGAWRDVVLYSRLRGE